MHNPGGCYFIILLHYGISISAKANHFGTQDCSPIEQIPCISKNYWDIYLSQGKCRWQKEFPERTWEDRKRMKKTNGDFSSGEKGFCLEGIMGLDYDILGHDIVVQG